MFFSYRFPFKDGKPFRAEQIPDVYDLYDLYDLYNLAHVAGWEPYNLHDPL